MNIWTSEEIAKILIQLDERKLPFEKYSVIRDDGTLKLLGRGGFADVYEAKKRGSQKNHFAIKVIGFGDKHSDSAFFRESVQAQKEIGDFQDNVVRIYDHTELWVLFDEEDHIISAVKEKPKELPRKSLKLQFIAMENICSVFSRTKSGNIHINPEQLAAGEEQEVLKLAHDIGKALQKAHNKSILHRDIKLENVFYSPRKKQYKLGDFGIAKITEDGFASTVAFTKGYAAPEVRGTQDNDKYDNTADIYSFGIMLFILMNNLKFPDSNTYNVNSNMQYRKGYIVPRPENASKAFYDMIARMCMYDPDARYQSMEEVITDIEKLMYSETLSYKTGHKEVSLIVGTILLLLGVAVWKITLVPQMQIRFSLWEYLFWGCCLGKFVQRAFRKDVIALSMVVLGLGILIMISGGFSWIKLIVLLCMVFSSGTTAGLLSGGALTAGILYAVQQQGNILWEQYREYSWIAVTLLSFSFALLFQYELLILEDRMTVKRVFNKGVYWVFICLFYATILLAGSQFNQADGNVTWFIWPFYKPMKALSDMGVDYYRWGVSGLAFCMLWMLRERVLIWYEKGKIEKRYEE